MITLLFVEGERDFYFFYYLFQKIKNFTDVDISRGFSDTIFYHYSRRPRKVVQQSDEFLLLVCHSGKQAAKKAFVEIINELIRVVGNVNKVLLILDRDNDKKTKSKIFREVASLKTRFPSDPLQLINRVIHQNLEEHLVKRRSIGIRVGIVDIEPNLDKIISDFIKEQHILPDSKCKGDYDEIIKETMNHYDLNIDNLCKRIVEQHKDKLVPFLQRFNIKDSICQFFKNS